MFRRNGLDVRAKIRPKKFKFFFGGGFFFPDLIFDHFWSPFWRFCHLFCLFLARLLLSDSFCGSVMFESQIQSRNCKQIALFGALIKGVKHLQSPGPHEACPLWTGQHRHRHCYVRTSLRHLHGLSPIDLSTVSHLLLGVHQSHALAHSAPS